MDLQLYEVTVSLCPSHEKANFLLKGLSPFSTYTFLIISKQSLKLKAEVQT